MKRVILATALLLVAALAFAGGEVETVSAAASTDGFQRYEADGFTFEWQIEGDDITIRISAPTTGWVAIGFDPVQAMEGADYAIGYVTDGRAVVEDHWGHQRYNHREDEGLGGSTDTSDVTGSEGADGTTLTFTRPLAASDEYDNELVPGREHLVIWAYGRDGADNVSERHRARGAFRLQL